MAGEGVVLFTDNSPECLRAAEMLNCHGVAHEPVSSSKESIKLPAAIFKGAAYQGITGICALLDQIKSRHTLGT